MTKEKTGDYYCLHHQNLMLTSNINLPDGCVCLWNRFFLVKLSKGIAVESSSKLPHNLPNSVLTNVDVTAMAMKQSLILQLIKLTAILTCTVERRCPLIHTYMYKNEGCICVKQTFLLLPLSCPFYSLFLENWSCHLHHQTPVWSPVSCAWLQNAHLTRKPTNNKSKGPNVYWTVMTKLWREEGV